MMAIGLARLLQDAIDHVAYSVDRETQAILSVLRLVPESRSKQAAESLAGLIDGVRRFGEEQTGRVHHAADRRALELGLSVPVQPSAAQDPQVNEASRIIVRRRRFGTLTAGRHPPLTNVKAILQEHGTRISNNGSLTGVTDSATLPKSST